MSKEEEIKQEMEDAIKGLKEAESSDKQDNIDSNESEDSSLDKDNSEYNRIHNNDNGNSEGNNDDDNSEGNNVNNNLKDNNNSEENTLKDNNSKKITSDSDKVAELTNDIKRLQAEFENYKKRSEKETVKLCEYSKADVLKKFLPILDSFELAFKNTKNHEEFVKGIELIFAQFHNFLKDNGIRPIEIGDRKADPYLDDVMLTEKSEEPSGTILEELQKGYKFNNIILRHAKVKVSKND